MSIRDIIMSAAGGGVEKDPHFANVKLLLSCDGANGSTTFTDLSPSARGITSNGVTVSTAQSKFGGASAAWNDGNTTLALSSAITMAGDFTIETWVNQTSATSGPYYPLLFAGSPNVQFMIDWGGVGKLGCYLDGTTIQSSTGPFVRNQWNHLAWVRSGSAVWIYYNGAPVVSGTHSASVSISTLGYPSAGFNLNGYRDEIRITDGVSRYASGASFTPPTGPFPRS